MKYINKAWWLDNMVKPGSHLYDQETHMFISKDTGEYTKPEILEDSYWVYSGSRSIHTILKEPDDYWVVKRRRFMILHLIKAEIQHLWRKLT